MALRLENIADVYDKGASTQKVEIEDLLFALYESANGGVKPASVFIYEMSLTGNMKLTEMQERKIKWNTVDDHLNIGPKLDYSVDQYVTLEPQRIRVFNVRFEAHDMLA